MHTRHHEFDPASRAIAADGWCVLPTLMTARQTHDLAGECSTMHDEQLLTSAHVGRDRDHSALRGDRTCWFEPLALSAPQGAFAGRIEQLRIGLNRALMLGLVDSESHYAMYPPGAGYARHLDRLRHSDARVLSAVFYLNDAWQESDGGALRLHLADGSYRDVYPHAGTLLLFLSAQFEHEVLPATRQRMSIACWMRQRDIG
ncbi:MAG: 2OG-Fe(II) oxygenase [Rhodanobacter sp.]|jgi:SM-20-related protein|nr:2OG-Fe(II) oxygenase [Rhodanobacter sp.]